MKRRLAFIMLLTVIVENEPMRIPVPYENVRLVRNEGEVTALRERLLALHERSVQKNFRKISVRHASITRLDEDGVHSIRSNGEP